MISDNEDKFFVKESTAEDPYIKFNCTYVLS